MIWISLEGWSPVTDYSSSAGKESTCNVGDTGLSPWLGRSPGEGIGYPLQYSWASLVALMVKNLPGMWETWVWSLDWEDPLKEGMATHSSILTWRIPMAEEPGGIRSMVSQRVRHDWATKHGSAIFKITHVVRTDTLIFTDEEIEASREGCRKCRE